MENEKNQIIMSFTSFLIAILLATIIVSSPYHTQSIPSIWIFIFKLLPFFFALIGISLFPSHKIKPPWNLILIILGFGIVFCYFFPKQAYFFLKSEWENFYLVSQMMIPFIILLLAFTMKMFGLKIKETFIFGLTCIIFMLSGIEDLFFLLLNPNLETGEFMIPNKWDWAHHMTIRVGRVLSKNEAFAFIALHFLIIIFIFYFSYSNNRWIRALKEKLKRSLPRENKHITHSAKRNA